MLPDHELAHHYRPQLNPEFVRRARENNRRRMEEEKKRRDEAEARARAKDIERKRQASLEAIEAAKTQPVDEANPEPSKPVVLRTEFQRVLDRLMPVFGITYTELKSHRRNREVAFARQAICYWLCRRTEMSLPQIGRMLGGRDHSTILHAKKAYPAKRAEMGRKLRPTR